MARKTGATTAVSKSAKKPNNPDLVGAAFSGDLLRVDQLLAAGASPNSTRRGWTALMTASRVSQPAIVERLLQAGARVRHVGKLSGSALVCAAHSRSDDTAETIRILLAAGSDVTAVDGDGNTALHGACLYGHLPAVRLLLAAGASVTTRNRDRRQPLQLAVFQGHTDIVQALIDLPGAVESLDDYLVFAGGCIPLMQFLLGRGANPNHRSVATGDSTALGNLAYSGNIDGIHVLLAAGADPMQRSGRPALLPSQIASANGQAAAKELLLAAESRSA